LEPKTVRQLFVLGLAGSFFVWFAGFSLIFINAGVSPLSMVIEQAIVWSILVIIPTFFMYRRATRIMKANSSAEEWGKRRKGQLIIAAFIIPPLVGEFYGLYTSNSELFNASLILFLVAIIVGLVLAIRVWGGLRKIMDDTWTD
jgi:hypothetical protein